MTDEQMRERVAKLFLSDAIVGSQYDPAEDGVLTTVIPGVIWQCTIYPRGSAVSRVLRVYALDNGNAILERFWANEVRALHRISARGHRLLPILHEAANVRELGLGFIIVEDAGDPLERDQVRLTALRSDRLLALKTFANLVDAVATLHAEGIVHRSISPRVIVAASHAPNAIQLDGFQMSAFVAGLLRGGAAQRDRGSHAFIPSSSSAVFFAPERLAWLVNGYTRTIESFSCDVFGLGMVALDWFSGPFPEEDAARVLAVNAYGESAHRLLVNAAYDRMRKAGVPTELRRLIEQMTAMNSSNRIPSAPEVSSTLGRLYGGLVAQFESAADAKPPVPGLVYFLRETIEYLYTDGLGRSSPQQPDEREYADLVEQDLSGGWMTWSPRGFEPWQKHDHENARRARVVLLGKRYAYFCQYLNEGARDEDPRVLLVKYPCALHKVKALRDSPRRREVTRVRAMFFDPSRRMRPVPTSTPSWQDHVEQVRRDVGREFSSPVGATAAWLVGYQEGLVAAGEYAFERVDVPKQPHDGPLPIVLRSTGHARLGDLSDRPGVFLELLRRESLLKPMGTAYAQQRDEAFEAGDELRFVIADSSGKDLGLRLRLDDVLDPDTIRFKSIENDGRVPLNGRVRPDESFVSLERQELAVRELLDRHDLLKQLREPRGIRLELGSPKAVDASLAATSPDAALLIRRILEEEPLFVLQGPPGTGKTFVASHLITTILRLDPLARILVSAQSNAATDNILEALEERLQGPGADWPLLLRHASAEAQPKLTARAKAYLLDQQVVAARDRITASQTKSPELAPIQKQWRRLAKDQDLDAELFQRLPRGANVVFATCVGAGAEVDALRTGPGFDWVILEEAAHAWLSEVAVALVQGDRWLLIGDHKQLPAHGAEEVERVFRRDVDDEVTVQVTGSLASDAWKPFLSHFRHLMEVPVPEGHWTKPRATIDEQRRMAPDIGELISTSYYDGRLRTHSAAKRPHKITGRNLGFLSETSLAWFDTSGFGTDAEDQGYRNELEIDLIRKIVSCVDRFPTHDDKVPPLAIISPYKKQLLALKDRVIDHRDITDECFRTVDSVQGRQAEVVIVSLVRNNALPAPGKALGFLRAPERANVTFSRARRLLLIVGSLAHFARFPSTHWASVVEYVRGQASKFIVDPHEMLGFTPRRGRQ